MDELKITIYGNATELLIGSFPKNGADWIVDFYEEFKPHTDIEEIWYGEGLIPEEWTKGNDWSHFDKFFHKLGFAFSDKDEIQWFLDRQLAPEPKIKGIYINDKIIECNLSDTVQTYTEIDLPYLNNSEVFVYHGVVYTLSIDYILDIQDPFSIDTLNLHFISCDENGYFLTEIEYNGKQMKRFYSGSKILVKSDFYSLNSNNMDKIWTVVKTKNFLDVKFKK